MEVEELHPPQRHRTLPRLRVVWSGQGRHKLKVTFRLDNGKMVFLPLSVKIRSRYWSHQILGASGVRFSAISAVCYTAGLVPWRPINFRLPASFLQRCWVPCTFSSAVLASNWTPRTFSSTAPTQSRVLLLLEL